MQLSFKEETLVVTVVIEDHLLNMAASKGMVQKEDFSVHLEELSDLKVTVVSQCLQEGKYLVHKEGEIVTRGSFQSMEGDTHAALVVRIGQSHLGPRPRIRITTRTTVADLVILPPPSLPPPSRAASDAGGTIVAGIVDCTGTGPVNPARSVEKCTTLELTDTAVLRPRELVVPTELVDTKVSLSHNLPR